MNHRLNLFVAALLAFVAPVAFAQSSTYGSIVSAVSWADVTTGIVAIAALVAAVLVVKRGVRMLLGVIGR